MISHSLWSQNIEPIREMIYIQGAIVFRYHFYVNQLFSHEFLLLKPVYILYDFQSYDAK